MYDNPINQPVIIGGPKKSSKKIIWYVVFGFMVIIGIIYLHGLYLIKEGAKNSRIDQVQYMVDKTCLVVKTGQQIDSKEIAQILSQKYNLSPSELVTEEEKMKWLYSTDPSFKKKVQVSLLKSGCK